MSKFKAWVNFAIFAKMEMLWLKTENPALNTLARQTARPATKTYWFESKF
jgi:hypothetical protein